MIYQAKRFVLNTGFVVVPGSSLCFGMVDTIDTTRTARTTEIDSPPLRKRARVTASDVNPQQNFELRSTNDMKTRCAGIGVFAVCLMVSASADAQDLPPLPTARPIAIPGTTTQPDYPAPPVFVPQTEEPTGPTGV